MDVVGELAVGPAKPFYLPCEGYRRRSLRPLKRMPDLHIGLARDFFGRRTRRRVQEHVWASATNVDNEFVGCGCVGRLMTLDRLFVVMLGVQVCAGCSDVPWLPPC